MILAIYLYWIGSIDGFWCAFALAFGFCLLIVPEPDRQAIEDYLKSNPPRNE